MSCPLPAPRTPRAPAAERFARPRTRRRPPRGPRAALALRRALARAADLAAPYAEEAAAVERIRRFLDAEPAQPRRPLRPRDLLLTAAILLTAPEVTPTAGDRLAFELVDRAFGIHPRARRPLRAALDPIGAASTSSAPPA